MQLFKYMTLTFCQQMHPEDVVLPPRGKQNYLSKMPIEEDGKQTKNMNLTQNFDMKKRKSVTLNQCQSRDGVE